ncbi:MAG: hypothetical protein HY226_00410 [Candidatus Vogelbacteria bacterium]|nr:hypothetical protein [Candidatus Vogelbacteria bacterium]
MTIKNMCPIVMADLDGKKIIIPALKKGISPEERLRLAKLDAERAVLELAILEEEDKASRLRIQLEERQRHHHEQMIKDIQNDELTALEDKRKEKNGKVKN